MDLLFVKVALAPLIILIATLIARRLGPRAGGFFIGLPTTALPFMLTMYLMLGLESAVVTATGAITGQLTCALFCIAYPRTGPRLGALSSMVAALAVAAVLGLATVALGAPMVVAGLALVVILAGLLTWPAVTGELTPARNRRWDLPLRMGMACVTVVTVSSLQPYLGTALAGAVASLPTILMVMCPAVHHAEGVGNAVELTRGTLTSIPATVVYLVSFVLLAPHVGMWWALAVSLVAIPITTVAVSRGPVLLREVVRFRRPLTTSGTSEPERSRPGPVLTQR
ncbi:hypothetical protein GWK18_04385 [Kocuria sp. JC486]|uniref:hypothetical protein n=1 Tax=Kocuria sp. JC486 TaxID=1970736 RepID=UPI00141F1BD5|nr:hypothetical protein [Kocuria sp. JC486]NHU84837.1 hypothetical protein [Kocuria sp. JC486]